MSSVFLKIFVFLPPQHPTPINCFFNMAQHSDSFFGNNLSTMFSACPHPLASGAPPLNSSHQVVLSLLFPSPQLNLSDIHSPKFTSHLNLQLRNTANFSLSPSTLLSSLFLSAHLRFHDPSFNIIIIYKHHPLPLPSSSSYWWQTPGCNQQFFVAWCLHLSSQT